MHCREVQRKTHTYIHSLREIEEFRLLGEHATLANYSGNTITDHVKKQNPYCAVILVTGRNRQFLSHISLECQEWTGFLAGREGGG